MIPQLIARLALLDEACTRGFDMASQASVRGDEAMREAVERMLGSTYLDYQAIHSELMLGEEGD